MSHKNVIPIGKFSSFFEVETPVTTPFAPIINKQQSQIRAKNLAILKKLTAITNQIFKRESKMLIASTELEKINRCPN